MNSHVLCNASIYDNTNRLLSMFDNLNTALVELSNITNSYLLVVYYLSTGNLINTYKYIYDVKTQSYVMTKNNIRKNIKMQEDVKEDTKEDVKEEIKDIVSENILAKLDEEINTDSRRKRKNPEDKKQEEKKQEDKKQEEKKQENLSIFSSDKGSYLMFKSKINKETLQEKNISPLFIAKYHIIKFMDINELINFDSNDDIQIESDIYLELHKVIESMDYKKENVVEKCKCDNNKDCDCEVIIKTKDEDPLKNIGDEYNEVCNYFMEYLTELKEPIYSSKSYHKILDSNMKLKNELFKDAIAQEIFE
jgi:hypothetical protein